MPISAIKLETEFCLDAQHAQSELLAYARTLAAEDTRLHYELTGETEITVLEGTPEMVCEIMADEPGMLWRGRFTGRYSSRPLQGEIEPTQADPVFETVVISEWGTYTIRHDMDATKQIEMWQEIAADQGAPANVVDRGTKILTERLHEAAQLEDHARDIRGI